MAETVGRAEIDVDIDGRGLEQQVRALGQQIGRTLGRSIAQTFGRQMKQLSADLDKSMKEMSASAEAASARTNTSIDSMSHRFSQLSRDVRDTNSFMRKFMEDSRTSSEDIDRMSNSLDRNSHSWKSLPHGMRQAIFYTGLFAAMGDEIAVLGSVAGSSLTVLAGAAGAVAVGVGVGIAAFKNLSDEIGTLPEVVQPAAQAFQDLGNAFDILQDNIQAAAASGLTEGFSLLKTTVEGLTPALEGVGATVGQVFSNFAQSIAPGTQGFENLVKLIDAASPVLISLSNAAMSFGQAMGNVFVVAIPYVQQFADWLAKIAGDFLAWTNTLEGQKALEEWFQNGMTVMQAIQPLIVAVADALNKLVTPETVQMTVEFLETMTEFIPILGEMLAVIGELNVFNILAEILLAIGQAIQPIIPYLSQFAAIISDSLIYAVQQLVEPLSMLLITIGPMIPMIAQLAAAMLVMALEAVIPLIDGLVQIVPLLQPIFEELVELIPEFVLLGSAIGEVLLAALEAIIPLLIPLIDLLISVLIALEPILPVVVALAALFAGVLAAAIKVVAALIGGLINIINALIEPFAAMGKQMSDASNMTDLLSDTIDDSMGMFRDWGDTIADVVSSVMGFISDAIDGFLELFGMSANAPTPGNGGGNGRGFASGGIVSGAAYRLTGEAGPEAIVPLNRPLSMVDPAVRQLSAFAQGLGGAGGGASKIVNVEAGAVVVQGALDPVATANETVNRMAERIGSK